MLGDKRSEFMTDIRKKKREELINRRRLMVLPDTKQEVEVDRFSHLAGSPDREQII